MGLQKDKLIAVSVDLEENINSKGDFEADLQSLNLLSEKY